MLWVSIFNFIFLPRLYQYFLKKYEPIKNNFLFWVTTILGTGVIPLIGTALIGFNFPILNTFHGWYDISPSLFPFMIYHPLGPIPEYTYFQLSLLAYPVSSICAIMDAPQSITQCPNLLFETWVLNSIIGGIAWFLGLVLSDKYSLKHT